MKQPKKIFWDQKQLVFLFLALILLVPTKVNAQTSVRSDKHIVTGQVVDISTNIPIIGANVWLKGKTSTGTTTDNDGKYSLNIDGQSNETLVVSYIGYEKMEIVVGNRTKINIELNPSTEMLEQVVVVGYGTQKKVSLTGAIASISNKDIITTKSSSLAVALAGKIPGLMIRQTTGVPGAFDTNISMRGQGTPLFVIDGIVRSDSKEFQKLNPEDIESVTVLKDASAAIYGINSSNGVIVVKTRSGSKGPLKVSYNALFGFAKPTEHTKMLNVSQYWELRNEDQLNSTGSPYFSSRSDLEAAQRLPFTDWYGNVFKNSSFQHDHTITLEGGTDKISTYTSLGYTNDNGLLISGDIGYEKYSFRTGINLQPSDDWKIDVILSGYTDTRKQPGTWNGAFFYLNKATHGLIPSDPIFANNNSSYFNRPAPLNDNPIQFADRDIFGYREWKDILFESSVGITYSVPWVKGLKLRAQGAYDLKTSIDNQVQKRAINYTYSAKDDSYKPWDNYDPSIQEEHWLTTRVNMQGQIMYNTCIAKDHNIDAIVVIEGRTNSSRYLKGKRFYEGSFFTIDNIDRAPEEGQQTGGNTGENTYLSYIGRFNYNFRNKYLVEFACREDGSYRYAPSKRWGFFPVISGGWRISEEAFLKNYSSVISNIKLRVSYGKTGYDEGNAFQFIPGYKNYNGYVFSDGKLTTGFTNAGLVNDELTWNISKTLDIGIDISLWNGKLDFTGDIYRKNRSGLLTTRAQALPNIFGASLPQENLNSDRNDGFDMIIGHRNTIREFEYGVSFNINMNRWMVTHSERAPFRSSWDQWRNSPINRWGDIGWGYQVVGQYQNFDEIRNGTIETSANGNAKLLPGDYIHLDTNADGIINDKDRMPIFWNGQPKVNYGINISAGWKGIDFNMLWQGAAKYSLKYNEVLGYPLSQNYSNSPAIYYDRWHQADPYDMNSSWIPGKYPAIRAKDADDASNRLESNIQRVNASYARLKNIELGYTIPSSLLKGSGISNLRCYVNCFNAFVICNSYLKNFDPEINDGNGLQYPLSRTYNIGMNITF